MRLAKNLCLILVFLCCLPFAALAQVGGSIDGTISDPGGAVIAGAKVTATQVKTGFKITADTTEAGLYAFTLLPEGPYTITVIQPGFKTLIREGLEVRVGLSETVDLKLEIGAVQQTVQVNAAPPVLETNNETRGTGISPQTMDMLPLFFGGSVRLANAFLGYMPGVNSNGETSINGSTGRASEIMIDGGSIISPESGGVAFYFPGYEAYGEFKLVTSGFLAEDGRVGGGIQEFVTKSGTNQVHASAFFNFERQTFNANSWSNNQNTTAANFTCFGATHPSYACRPKLRYNDMGGAAGGPIYIPKVYDGRNKSFFYFTYENYQQPATPLVASGLSTPTAAMLSGNFAGLAPIYDPATTGVGGNAPGVRTQFSGNVIPAARFSSISKNIIPFIPAPTVGSAVNPQGNYTFTGSSLTSDEDWSIKVDHTIGTKHHLAFFYTHRDFVSNTVMLFPGPLSDGGQSPQLPHQWRGSWDWTVNPHVLLHTFFSASLDNVATNTPLQHGYGCKLGFTNDICGSNQDSTPVISFQTDLTAPSGDGNLTGTINCGTCLTWGQDQGKVNNAGQQNRIWMGGQSLSWIRNKHEFKTGWEIRRSWTLNNDWSSTNGNYLFNSAQTASASGAAGVGTGNSFASFLLGDVNQASTGALPVFGANIRYAYTAGFIEDTWRIHPRVTLNLGFRYEVPINWHYVNGTDSSFSPSAIDTQAGNLPGAMIFMGSGPGHTGTLRPYQTDFSDIGPRAGVAYRLTNSMVIRTAFGLFYEGEGNGGCGCTDGYGGVPFSQTGDGFDPTFDWDKNPNGTPGVYPPAGYVAGVSQTPGVDNFGGGTPYYMGPKWGKAPRVYNWNFTIQKEYKNWLFEIAYDGNRTHGAPSTLYINTVPDNDLYLENTPSALLGGTIPAGTNLLAYSFNNAAQASQLNQLGYYSPSGLGSLNPTCAGWATCWTSGWGSGANLSQALRTYPQMGPVYYSNSGDGWLSYDSLQVKFEHRFGDLNFEGTYVWSKTLDILTYRQIFGAMTQFETQDPQNIPDAKSFSNSDIPNVVNFTLSYNLPFGRGKKFMGSAHGWVNDVIGGWTFAGVGNYRSGLLIELTNPTSPETSTYMQWPLTKVTTNNGATLKTNVSTNTLDPNNHNNRWFATTPTGTSARFSTTALGSLGTSSIYENQMRQPWFRNENISVNKVIPIYGEGRDYLRISINAANIFNRTDFGGVNGTINSTLFGVPTGVQDGARQISMGLRLYF